MKWLYLLAIPALLGGSYVAAQSYYGGRILPNVLVAGVNLGGMTVQDAKTALEAVKTSTPTVTVKVGKREYVLPASDLGWTPDVDASAQAALEQGKDATVFNHLSGGEQKTLPLQGVVSQDVLKAKLRELALDQDRMPVRAKAVFTKAKYEIRNDVKGLRANVGAAMVAFLANPSAETLEMPLETVSALVTRETLQPRVTEANALIRPLKVIYPVKGGVKSLVIGPLSVADLFWLRDTLEPDKATLEAKLKQVGLQLDRGRADLVDVEHGAVGLVRVARQLLADEQAVRRHQHAPLRRDARGGQRLQLEGQRDLAAEIARLRLAHVARHQNENLRRRQPLGRELVHVGRGDGVERLELLVDAPVRLQAGGAGVVARVGQRGRL